MIICYMRNEKITATNIVFETATSIEIYWELNLNQFLMIL